MANILKIILFLVIVVGIGIYFFSNSSKIFQAPAEKVPSPFSQQSVSYPSAGSSIQSASPASVSSPNSQIQDYQIPSGYGRSDLSVYFQKIRISSAYTSYSSYPNYYPQTQIQLYSGLAKGETIDITGWKIKSNRQEFTIPPAINVYSPSGLSQSSDIVISGNASVGIYSSKSPVNANFRLNKCAGYLENTYDFNPPLPQNCPTVSKSEISYLSGDCQNYVSSLWGCKVPDVNVYNSFPGNDQGNACRQFLSNISFNSCFQKHSGDADFLSSEWRVWLNWTASSPILDSQHDKVLLLDRQGLLVDQYTY